jgi:hypothetical protein
MKQKYRTKRTNCPLLLNKVKRKEKKNEESTLSSVRKGCCPKLGKGTVLRWERALSCLRVGRPPALRCDALQR